MATLPVAVVIPAYNRAHLLPRALASVAAQRPHQPQEVIVVDDASMDGTGAVARELGARVLRHSTNLGPAAARRTGFAATDAPWVIQLDSDDEWLPHCLATLWDLRNGHVLVSGGSVGANHRDEAWYNGPVGKAPQVLTSPAELAFPDNFIASSAVLLRMSCVRAAGGYRTDLRYAEDLELWLRMLELGTAIVTPRVVSLYHSHGGQATATREEIHAGHAKVLELSVDRAWWDRRIAMRWSAVPHWDGLRTAIRRGYGKAAVRHGLALCSHPQRLVGLAIVLNYRLRRRRWSARLTVGALPSVAVLPGADYRPSEHDIDLRAQRPLTVLARLIRRPPAVAIIGRRWQVPLLSLLQIDARIVRCDQQQPRNAALAAAARFQWSTVADQTARVYELACEHRARRSRSRGSGRP
jgi:glycosyltransferase involved in cell wall biosynthesis